MLCCENAILCCSYFSPRLVKNKTKSGDSKQAFILIHHFLWIHFQLVFYIIVVIVMTTIIIIFIFPTDSQVGFNSCEYSLHWQVLDTMGEQRMEEGLGVWQVSQIDKVFFPIKVAIKMLAHQASMAAALVHSLQFK
jgi:hypothetical protein